MKHQILGLLLILFITSACNNKQESGDTGKSVSPESTNSSIGIFEPYTALDPITGRPIEVQRPVNAISAMLSVNPIKEIDPIKPIPAKIVPKTPEEEKILRIFTKNYWMIWGLVRIGQHVNRINQGGCFKFHADGTFEFSLFDKPISKGAWSFDAQKGTVFIDSELVGDDREWTFDIHSSEEAMVWVGTNRFYLTDVQVKLDNYYNIPKTRAEAALPDVE